MFGIQVSKNGQTLTGYYDSESQGFRFFLISKWYYFNNIENLWEFWVHMQKDIKV